MKIAQILIKSTTCKWWSTGRLEKYWKPWSCTCINPSSCLLWYRCEHKCL